jgi:hypothetical protein
MTPLRQHRKLDTARTTLSERAQNVEATNLLESRKPV